jgi:hypothetical protein
LFCANKTFIEKAHVTGIWGAHTMLDEESEQNSENHSDDMTDDELYEHVVNCEKRDGQCLICEELLG